jgi:hypothetical protein
MDDMIVIQAMDDGRWEIQVIVNEAGKTVKRGKQCRI